MAKKQVKKKAQKTVAATNVKGMPQPKREVGVTDELHNLSVAYHELNLKLRVLDRMLKLFHAPKRIKTNLDAILSLCIDVADCETGTIFLVDQEAGDLFFATVHGPKAKDLENMHLAFGQGIVGICAQDQKTLIISDVTKDPRYCKEISEKIGFKTRSILAVPITYKGNVLGVIETINKKSSDTYNHFEVKLVERIAEISGTLLIIASQLKKQK